MGQAAEALLTPQSTRAWTITGPYGTGKSAFALALTQLLTSGALHSAIFSDLQREDPRLAEAFGRVHAIRHRLVPVLISGERGLLAPALLRSLEKAIENLVHSEGRTSLGDVLVKIRQIDPEDTSAVCRMYEQAARATGGLLVIIDELGKFLEFIAQRPDRADAFGLQLLAEAAARSGDHPILLFTILHQAFALYGSQLTQAQREEFSKVQGRFQDIAFNQSQDQMLRLIGKALVFQGNAFDEAHIRTQVKNIAVLAARSGSALAPGAEAEFSEQLALCAPLHPITALLLGPLFRRLAQNERSLFAFVSSSESNGLQDFLSRASWKPDEPLPLYTPDLLYDYIHLALGTALYQDIGGRRWAQVEATLDRLSDGDPLERRIVKTVGLMAAVGEIGALRPNAEVLAMCYGLTSEEVNQVIDGLIRKSALVYRSFIDSYRLWEGSDVDIEARLVDARSHVDEVQSLDELLPKLLPSRPIVARRHSYEKGTLRFFEVKYTSPGNLAKAVEEPPVEGDGMVIYVLANGPAHEAEIRQKLAFRGEVAEDAVVVIPIHVAPALRGAALELERLRWVKDHTPELAGDLVALREIRSRIYETENLLKRELDYALAPTEGGLSCLWNGQEHVVENPRALNSFLSLVCDFLYPLSPALKNELVNRRQLSSAASAARRLLLEHMLEKSAVPNLGIEGHPPQMSMYLSLLKETKIHRQVNGEWRLVAPDEGSPLRSVWDAWEDFLQTCQAQRLPVSTLWDRLRRPPLGLRDGVIPVFLVAMFSERSFDIGLYEQGTFIPDLTLPHVERLLKSPEKFQVRYCPIEGFKREVFDEVCSLVNLPADGRIISVVRYLCRTVGKLPGYAQKTSSVSKQAQKVRAALTSAREPDVLLFDELPAALGVADASGPDGARVFALKLEQALRELKNAHYDLHDKLFSMLRSALHLSESTVDEARCELENRVRMVRTMAVDLRMKAFLAHCDNPTADYHTWIEALGSLLASRPPATWSDTDLAKYESELASVGRKFNNLVELAVESGRVRTPDGVQALRLGLTQSDGPEQQKVIILDKAKKTEFDLVARSVSRLFDEKELTEEGRLLVLALLAQSLLPKAENQ